MGRRAGTYEMHGGEGREGKWTEGKWREGVHSMGIYSIVVDPYMQDQASKAARVHACKVLVPSLFAFCAVCALMMGMDRCRCKSSKSRSGLNMRQVERGKAEIR
jgi:hypothetical protein